MKIVLLIIIAYIILGFCSVLGCILLEYKTDYSHYTLEGYYDYVVEGEELVYISICIFWPLADIVILLFYGTKYLTKACIDILKYFIGE